MSRQRQKGTGFETELLPSLRDTFGEHVERAPLRGIGDDGDFTGCRGLLVEAKKHDSPRWSEWITTAARKRPDGSWRIVWSGDRRKANAGPFVLMPLDEWLLLERERCF